MAKFEPTEYCFRADGRIEWICEHGVGHTLHVPDKYKRDWVWWSHGCDGCCANMFTDKKGGARINSCEFDIHGKECEHGDCSCGCHDGEELG